MSVLDAFLNAQRRWRRWRDRDVRAHRKDWRGPRAAAIHKKRKESWRAFKKARRAWRKVRRGKGYLTPHFFMKEFDCKDGTPVPAYMKGALRSWCHVIGEPMRSKFGPLTVHSGYRTWSYNRKVGGVSDSYHIYTVRRAYPAVDFSCTRGTPDEWGRFARRQLGARGGVGIYPSQHFTHVDARPMATNWRG